MERKQFTFYRSFWEATDGLSKKDQTSILTAIIKYALDGDEPGEKDLSATGKRIFGLIKPTLEASRKKSAAGQQTPR
ncbi:MAG: hypothetical protein IKZ82_06305 [Clostridia bacterium]|nr:hypothetical protein [Clostridia bacterium]